MHCGSSSRSQDYPMNDGEFTCYKEGGAATGGSENSFEGNLTKQQLQCLEATFMKFLIEEMETNLSNWEEFYDLLNEACKPDVECVIKKTGDKNMKEGTSYPNGCTGLKINTEATRQQYKTCKLNLKSSFCEQKPDKSAEQKRNYGVNNKENHCQFTNSNKEEEDFQKKTYIGKKEETKKTCDTLPKCTKGSKRKNPKATKQYDKDDVDTRDNPVLMNNNVFNSSSTTESVPSKNLELYVHEYYLKCIVIINYISTSSKLCWQKTKEIILFILCILLIVIVAVWKVLWFLICFIFKVVLFVVLWVMCNLINCTVAITTKYDILGAIKSVFSHGSDLIFLITGLNFKSMFSRQKKDAVDEHEDNSVAIMPTSPEEAVVHLMQQTEDKPFKALCVTRQSTNDEIKTNYRKLALLVHPDKCLDTQADEAFKVLDSAFKTLTDPEKRNKLMEENKRRKEWEEFTKRYSNFEEDFETMFNDLINSISCSKCHGKHKRTLVKDRTFYNARYCGDCNIKHSANDGDIWAENSLFGLNWTCYVCMDGEIYELTEWAECQNLRKTIPVNCHRIVCRLGNQPNRAWPNDSTRRRNKQSESSEPKRSRKKRRQRGRKS